MNLKERYQARFGIKQPLRGYQLKAANLGITLDSYALLMAPRLGKTRIDIAATGGRFLRGEVSKWVIVCPSIAKDVWKTELADTLAVPHEITVIEGKADERKALIKEYNKKGTLNILIINPEATWRLKKLLYKVNPDKVTVDESHRIKNHAAKQSRTLHTLGTRASYRAILTGTFMSSPSDVFSQFKFLEPSIFGTKYKKGGYGGSDGFLEQYVETYGVGGFKPKTWKNLDQLSAKVASVAFQLTREQAGGFPQELYQSFTFPLTNPAKKHYLEMFDDLATAVKHSEGSEDVVASIVLTQLVRLQQIASGFLPTTEGDQELGNDRIKALEGLLSEYPTTEPLVILCRFHFELQAVATLLDALGRTHGTISGRVSLEDRNVIKKNFQDGKLDTVVVQVKAAGIAIDLSRARTSIFYSTPQSYIDYEQAKARMIARTGGSVAILHLIAEGTVDEDIIESLRNRENIVTRILSKINS